MYDVIFLSDVQDIWLFNYFLLTSKKNGNQLKIIYDKTGKITSPHRALEGFKDFGILPENLIRYGGVDSQRFKEIVAGCRWFITKDFLPTGLSNELLARLIVVSWVGESGRRKSCNARHGIVRPGYKRLYVEKNIQPLYHHIGFISQAPSPKYYFLNDLNRKSICSVFNLDPAKKYITLFSNVFFDSKAHVPDGRDVALNDRVAKIFSHIKDFCQKNGIEIILKNKAKYGNAFADTVYHHHHVTGQPSLFHQGVMLMAISEFSVGFATSAVLEAEELGARFISFWKHDRQSVDEGLYDDIVSGTGSAYRLAQTKDTFIIDTRDLLDDIIDSLDTFMKNSKSINLPRFKVEKFLRDNFGDLSE